MYFLVNYIIGIFILSLITEYKNNMSKSELIYQLETISLYILVNDKSTASSFRIKQYNDVISIIKLYPYTSIQKYDDLESWIKINGMKNPSKILAKIKEFFSNGQIQEYIQVKDDNGVNAYRNLSKIYGIGPGKCKSLYEEHNITTIDELKKRLTEFPKLLNSKQKIGLLYYEDLEQRIPRKEIDEFCELLDDICKNESHIIYSINGSYRRGLETSGDIDILLCSKTNIKCKTYIVDQLKKSKILIEVLADGEKKLMGIARLNNNSIARRIDIIETTINEYPFAQLYFTGSGAFNVSMRQKAISLGYSLNEYGIIDLKNGSFVSSDVIYDKLKKYTFTSEIDIFNFLDLTYVNPSDRIV